MRHYNAIMKSFSTPARCLLQIQIAAKAHLEHKQHFSFAIGCRRWYIAIWGKSLHLFLRNLKISVKTIHTRICAHIYVFYMVFPKTRLSTKLRSSLTDHYMSRAEIVRFPHSFLVKPLSMEMKMVIDKRTVPSKGTPKLSMMTYCHNLIFNVQEHQILDILNMKHRFHNYALTRKVRYSPMC